MGSHRANYIQRAKSPQIISLATATVLQRGYSATCLPRVSFFFSETPIYPHSTPTSHSPPYYHSGISSRFRKASHLNPIAKYQKKLPPGNENGPKLAASSATTFAGPPFNNRTPPALAEDKGRSTECFADPPVRVDFLRRTETDGVRIDSQLSEPPIAPGSSALSKMANLADCDLCCQDPSPNPKHAIFCSVKTLSGARLVSDLVVDIALAASKWRFFCVQLEPRSSLTLYPFAFAGAKFSSVLEPSLPLRVAIECSLFASFCEQHAQSSTSGRPCRT
ncbi:hypothetical protein EDB80DRAFT_24584 [Ilyonectria destructans]|nr:hypothetical protein EDB80DRAFT_24584 [Ilyonectria destructans]